MVARKEDYLGHHVGINDGRGVRTHPELLEFWRTPTT
jgi:hypothetical protein